MVTESGILVFREETWWNPYIYNVSFLLKKVNVVKYFTVSFLEKGTFLTKGLETIYKLTGGYSIAIQQRVFDGNNNFWDIKLHAFQ